MQAKQSGSALVISMLFAAVIAGAGAVAYTTLQSRYRQAHQTAAWEEALSAAESGIDLAVNSLRIGLQDPATAWASWNQSSNEVLDGQTTTQTANNLGPANGTTFVTSTVLLRKTEGGCRSWCEVQVDAPAALKDSNGSQWYRVRSIGIAEIPGGSLVAGDKADIKLRHVDLVTNHLTGKRLLKPQTSRTIETIIKPVSPFRSGAILADEKVEMNNLNITVDSYDSTDEAKSNYDPNNPSVYGTYNPAERQANGNVSTNGTLIDAGNAHIYGEVAAGTGGSIQDTKNVTGEISSGFYQELFPVDPPTLTAETNSPTAVRTPTDLQALPDRTANFVLSNISLASSDSLRIKGDPSGKPTFATIVVTGNISLSGQAQIILDPQVYVRIFVSGDGDFTGGGVLNPNSPLALQIYGTEHSDGQIGSIKVGGNGGLNAAIYAPNYNVTLVGGGVADNFYGAVVGKTVTMTGRQSIHYDEALAEGGLVSDYKIASWFEYIH